MIPKKTKFELIFFNLLVQKIQRKVQKFTGIQVPVKRQQ